MDAKENEVTKATREQPTHVSTLDKTARWEDLSEAVTYQRGSVDDGFITLIRLVHGQRARDGGTYTKTIEVTINTGVKTWAKDGQFDPFQVNWSSMGAQTPAFAANYADLILEASEVAAALQAARDASAA